MRAFLDACVLYPSVTRELLLGASGTGLCQAIWSPKVLEEWAATAEKRGGKMDGEIARGAIALMRASSKNQEFDPDPDVMFSLTLPDPDDAHVLAAAIAGQADILITLNAKDFPRHALNAHGMSREHPDAFLRALFEEDPDGMKRVAQSVFGQAQAMPNAPKNMAALFKKAGLPRFAKVFRS